MGPNRKRQVAVLGAGAWGTALANLAARPTGEEETEVTLWARDAAHVAEMRATGINARHLPGVPLLSNVRPIAEPAEVQGAELILAVVPAQALRPVLDIFAPHIAAGGVPVVVCAKGIERASGLFLTEVAAGVFPGNPPAILSGPSFAADEARGLPTAVTLAARDGDLAAMLAGKLTTPSFRLYSSSDVRGVEIGGAAKNVLAIASGIAAGRRLGESAGAALITRGFAELSRFGQAHGARAATLMGLSGLGDLVLTCKSATSRNYALGVAMGRGLTPAEAVARSGLCEGVHTCGALVDLAHAKGIDMPIAAAVDAVLAERIGVEEAIAALLARPPKAEFAEGD
ncbi:MAG: NAD(P)H-dependent glycerol-3-phosphate dehydrogenase [Methylocella sp.]